MTLKGFSPKTKKAYEGHIRRFCLTHSEVFLQLNVKNVHTYLLGIFEQERSHSYINQAMSASKLFLERYLDVPNSL
ncbi:phage integrase N-terminal SAM-like domain-containing protein [Paenibacillus alginolyticus]|uniref:phage integrase N-terminal SAM-like domain-containing protein n=1 Tax=Paenibacillus alginolyticus TaxID=59839 RepID=UPI0035E45578